MKNIINTGFKIAVLSAILLACIQSMYSQEKKAGRELRLSEFPLSDETFWHFITKDSSLTDSSQVKYLTYEFHDVVDTIEIFIGAIKRVKSIFKRSLFERGYSKEDFDLVGDTVYTWLDNTTLIFPLRVGKSWTFPDQRRKKDTLGYVKVERIEPVSIPAGYFDTSFVLKAYDISRDVESFYWIVPNIGFVKAKHFLRYVVSTEELVRFGSLKKKR